MWYLKAEALNCASASPRVWKMVLYYSLNPPGKAENKKLSSGSTSGNEESDAEVFEPV